MMSLKFARPLKFRRTRIQTGRLNLKRVKMGSFYWILLSFAGIAAAATVGTRSYSSGPSKDETLADSPAGMISQIGEDTKSQTAKSAKQKSKEDLLLRQLSVKVPDVPTFVDRETVDLMREVAETKRPEAAKLLIKCLAYNYDPFNQDEDRSDDMMIPAIQLLKYFFGESAIPLLYEEALSTDKVWFRDRIALAVSTILPESGVKELKERALSDAGVQPHAFEFYESLSAEHLDLQFNAPRDRRMAEIERNIEEMQKRNERRKPH